LREQGKGKIISVDDDKAFLMTGSPTDARMVITCEGPLQGVLIVNATNLIVLIYSD
jgi:hypothetical protein